MAEDDDNFSGYTQKRVFVHDLDSYASKNIAAVSWSQ